MTVKAQGAGTPEEETHMQRTSGSHAEAGNS